VGCVRTSKVHKKFKMIYLVGQATIPFCLQARLEAELKGKCDLTRIRKKLETDICELELALDHANR
jgi:hypothetical protein